MRIKPGYFFFLMWMILFACSSDVVQKNQPRGFEHERLNKLNTLARFDYDRTIEPADNYAILLLTKFFSFLAWIFNSFLGYIILAVLIALLIRIITGNISVFYKGFRDSTVNPLEIIPSDRDQVENYDALIEKALNAKDHRLAIRYIFLKTIQALSEKGIIHRNKEKTNREYLLELPPDFRKDFNWMSSVFEYVWYGRYQATAELCNFAALRMNALLNNPDF